MATASAGNIWSVHWYIKTSTLPCRSLWFANDVTVPIDFGPTAIMFALPTLIATMVFWFSTADARPVSALHHVSRTELPVVHPGESPLNRTMVVVFCLSYSFLIALALGYRSGRMACKKSKLLFSDILVFLQGFISTMYVFAAGINSAGLGLSTYTQCYNAIMVCIALYGIGKITLYLFLLERIRIVRAPFVDRFRDPIWITGTVVVIVGITTMVGCEYISPEAFISQETGSCVIGLPPAFGYGIVTLDIFINSALMIMFIRQLQPIGDFLAKWPMCWKRSTKTENTSRSAPLHPKVRMMLVRNVVGSAILLVPTVIINALFISRPFTHESHACQIMCVTDIVTAMLVTNWLSMRGAPAEGESVREFSGLSSTQSRSSATDPFGPGFETTQVTIGKPSPIRTTLCKQDR